MNWRQYGRNAILVEFADKPSEWAFHKGRAISEALAQKPPPQLIEFVPSYTTVLLEFDLGPGGQLEALARQTIACLEAHARKKIPLGPIREIAVKYDGPDLERVANFNGITPEKVIAFHSAPIYKVYLLGFAPGFPYLGELHHKLATPRLATPRPRVPAGSVAIGGSQTGIYPVDSPGGWNIIGHADVKIFDLSRARPEHEEEAFYLKPGDQVRFRAV